MMLILGISINAQEIPNLTTEFSDLTDNIIRWEMEEGDVVLYKYSRYYEMIPGQDEPEETQSPLYVKFFFNEERTQLLSVIIGFVKDKLYSIEYTIYENQRNLSQDRIIDGNMVFQGVDQDNQHFTLALISELPSISVYIGVDYMDGVYSRYVSAIDNISRASFEDIINKATQQDWDNRYNPD